MGMSPRSPILCLETAPAEIKSLTGALPRGVANSSLSTAAPASYTI